MSERCLRKRSQRDLNYERNLAGCCWNWDYLEDTKWMQAALGAETDPHWQPESKRSPRSYNCKKLNSANNPNELGSRSILGVSREKHSIPYAWSQLVGRSLTTLNHDFWPTQLWDNKWAVLSCFIYSNLSWQQQRTNRWVLMCDIAMNLDHINKIMMSR